MMKKRLLIITLILALLGTPIVALASDISGAKYWAVIQISNNSTATTNVATTCNISTTNLIAGNYLNASANNCVIRTSSGADVPFMPGYTSDNYPWCVWVPSIGENSYQSDILYTANSTGGEIRYFPNIGGMTTPDNDATLELGDNFTIEQSGWVRTTFTDNYSERHLVYKEEAFRTYVSGSGNITSAILADSTPVSGLSHNGLDNWNAAQLVDNNVTTTGFATTTAGVGSWMRIDYGAGYEGDLTAWRYYLSGATAEATWNIQYSDNASAWTTVYTGWDVFGAAGWQEVSWVSEGAHRYWRSYKTDAGAVGSTHEELEVIGYVEGPKVTATGVSSDNHTVKTQQILPVGSWWDYDWGTRRKLTFDNSGCSENLTNVPVAVSLNATSFDFSRAQADGDDIRFVNQADNATLDYFWETWESGNEIAIAWVEVPQIDALSSIDFIYIYWNNDEAANGEDMNGVFTADVKLAPTYAGSDAANLIDATSEGNDGAITGATWTQEAGGLWYLDFDGDNDNVVLASSNFPTGNTTRTILAWVKPDSFTSYDMILGYGTAVAFQGFIFSFYAATGYLTLSRYGGQADANGTTAFTAGVWDLAGVTFEGEDVIYYKSGVADGTATLAGADTVLDLCRVGENFWGAHGGDFDGDIILFRVYNRVLTAEEIEDKYLQEKHLFGISDGFITFGDAEYNELRIYIDSFLKDYTAGATVPDSNNSWTFIENNSMPYMEYQKIWIGGILRQHIVWEYDDEFTDLSGSSNPATPSFRSASSDPDVSAEMLSFQPVSEAKAPDYVLGEAPAFIDPGITGNVTGTFTTTPGTGTFPLANVIAAIADATETPAQLPLLIIACFVILAASLAVSATMRRYGSGSLIVKILIISAVMGIFIALDNFAIDFWMLVVFLIIGVALAFASRQLGWS